MAFSSFGSALLTLGRFGFLSLLVAAGATAVACGGETGRNGVRGDGQGSNGDGNGDGNGSGGLPGLPGDDDPSTGPNGQEYCQEADIVFEPRTPTVFVLVDRSGTIYDLQLWVPLRDGVLPVIQDLQSDVRFGFATYTGTNQMCTGLEQPVGAAMNNYDAIASAYTGLSTNHPGGKLETPTAYAIEQTADLLVADADATGDKFILLVTGDVDPDFCDDGETRCGADGVVAAAQVAYSRGVHTLVFAIEHAGISTPEWFDYYAQAGMGQHPNWPDGLVNSDQGGSIYSNCKDRVGIPAGYWQTLREQNGNTGFQPAGKYSVEGGTAQAFLNDDVSQIAAGIRTAVEGLKSCTFDLAASNVEVKAGSESQGEIFVNEELIPLDQWRMNSPTNLELLGPACETWQRPDVDKFFAGFPCDAIIVR